MFQYESNDRDCVDDRLGTFKCQIMDLVSMFNELSIMSQRATKSNSKDTAMETK